MVGRFAKQWRRTSASGGIQTEESGAKASFSGGAGENEGSIRLILRTRASVAVSIELPAPAEKQSND